jgi:hypothetical protein
MGGREGGREGVREGKARTSGICLVGIERERERDGEEMKGGMCALLKGDSTYHSTAGRGGKGGGSSIVVSKRRGGGDAQNEDIRDGDQEDEEEDELQGAKHSLPSLWLCFGFVCV